MDGTASLVYLLAAQQDQATNPHRYTRSLGAIVRGDTTKRSIALVFTGDEFADGLPAITAALAKHKAAGSFFFTGRFYRNTVFQPAIKQLNRQQYYLGPHSNAHLLYNDWTRRDSLLVSADSFRTDLQNNLAAIHALGIDTGHPNFFIPPYEWWNDTIAAWAHTLGWQLFNFTPGIRTNADYTWPEMGKSYLGSNTILQSLNAFRSSHPAGLNGAIILIHAGTDPRRKDKLYNHLDQLITQLQAAGYQLLRIDQLLAE